MLFAEISYLIIGSTDLNLIEKERRMRKSLLAPGGANKFQAIKKQCAEAEAKGIELLKLSIGQPSGSAPQWAKEAAAKAVMSGAESMHEYQDEGSPGCPDFARRFVTLHPGNDILLNCEGISYLPIPGIKPMLGVVIESMGAFQRSGNSIIVATTQGYPTPAYQASKAKNVIQKDLPFLAEQDFLPTLDDLDQLDLMQGDLIMLNLPNNPTGAVASIAQFEMYCEYCSEKGIRLFNDAAYSALRHDKSVPNLAQIAVQYPELSWCEAYSASKLGNMTGWRIGAMVGSSDFIGDISNIKGNTDSGFNAALASGVIALMDEKYYAGIESVRCLYERRIDVLVGALASDRCGLKMTVDPKAGFFVLFHAPKTAFGQDVEDAEEFNGLMINNTGIVGVPFGEYIRYAVCTLDIEAKIEQIAAGFEKANVGY